MSGKRFDQGKLEWHLLPIVALKECVKVMMMGRDKYGEYNYLEGMDWHRCYDSLIRHATSFWDGEDLDSESKILHTAHIAVNALFLVVYQLLGLGTDDRYINKNTKNKSKPPIVPIKIVGNANIPPGNIELVDPMFRKVDLASKKSCCIGCIGCICEEDNKTKPKLCKDHKLFVPCALCASKAEAEKKRRDNL